jgi:hypothetical protein
LAGNDGTTLTIKHPFSHILLLAGGHLIRPALAKDIDACVDLCIEFFEDMLNGGGINVIREDVKAVAVKSVIEQKMMVIEHNGDVQGLVAWEVVPHPANHSVKIFYETIWCVKSKQKTDTLLLLRTLEREADKAGAEIVVMANLFNKHESQMRRILLKRGYNYMESHFSKKLCERVY